MDSRRLPLTADCVSRGDEFSTASWGGVTVFVCMWRRWRTPVVFVCVGVCVRACVRACRWAAGYGYKEKTDD